VPRLDSSESRNMSQFKYTPLGNADDIRVVELLGGQPDEHNERRFHVMPGEPAAQRRILTTVSGYNIETYDAISYTWGNPSPQYQIKLDSKVFYVRQNLHSLLWFVRQEKDSWYYWIDAICINQDGAAEKSEQVKRMTKIYENAQQVVIWLGPPDDSSDLAFDLLEKVSELVKSRPQVWEATDQLELRKSSAWRDLTAEVTSEPFDRRSWKALESLLERDWWNRVWVVQESTTRVLTGFCCGTRHIWWSDISTAILLQYIQNETERKDLQAVQVWKFQPLRDFHLRRIQGGEMLKLLILLDDLRYFEASNLKDKVYAVIGIASGAEGFPVDYSKTLYEVLLDVARYSVNSPYGRRLDFRGYCHAKRTKIYIPASVTARLEQVEGGSTVEFSPEEFEQFRKMNEFEDLELPSWVPDWRLERSSSPFHKILQGEPDILGGSTSLGTAYSASGKSMDRILPYTADKEYISVDGAELVVKGFKIDGISELSSVSKEWYGKPGTALEATWEPHHIGPTYFTGETVQEAFLDTIVADVKTITRAAISRNHAMIWPDLDEAIVNIDLVFTLSHACSHRRLFITQNKLLGLAPDESQIGDEIFILFGGQVLYVLRPTKDYYLLVGECYIHGLMDGQALSRLDDGTAQLSTIRIR
jgi:hypothetical protein